MYRKKLFLFVNPGMGRGGRGRGKGVYPLPNIAQMKGLRTAKMSWKVRSVMMAACGQRSSRPRRAIVWYIS